MNYIKTQLDEVDGIPVFCVKDDYTENYDTIAAVHIESLKRGQGNPWNAQYEGFLYQNYSETIRNYLKPEDKVLDAGVCIGGIFDYIPEIKHKYGVDISIEFLKIARTKGIDVACAMIDNLPYPDHSFDMVCCKDVLEHVFNLYGTVKELTRVLKPGGYMIVQTPYNQSMQTYVNYTEYKYVHLRRFDEWDMIMMFTKIHKMNVISYRIVESSDKIAREINMLLQKPL